MRFALCVLLTAAACDNRACLAQSDLFAGFRPELIAECCACLASAGTRAPGAACAEAMLADDGTVAPSTNAGPAVPTDAPFDGDDLDAEVDGAAGELPAEVPCLCGRAENQCVAALSAGNPLLVTGACIAQGTTALDQVPCGTACQGVLTFDPIVASMDE